MAQEQGFDDKKVMARPDASGRWNTRTSRRVSLHRALPDGMQRFVGIEDTYLRAEGVAEMLL